MLALTFPDAQPDLRSWWILLSAEEVDMCDEDPGVDTDVHLDAPLRTFVRVWPGDLAWADALGPDGIRVHGPQPLCRAVPTWFKLSHFSAVPRPSRHGHSRFSATPVSG